MWRWLLGLAIVAGAVAGVLLGALNPEPVTLDLAIVEWTASLGAIIALAVGTGLVLGFLFALMLNMFRRRSHRSVAPGSSEAGKSLSNG